MSAAWSDVEHLDVLVISAGLSGIDAGHHLQTTCQSPHNRIEDSSR